MALTVSILQGGANSHATTSEEVNFVRTDYFSAGVVGSITNTTGVAPSTGSFAVNAQGTPDATVAVSAGVATVTATPTSGNSQLLRVKNSASANVTISANSTGGTRYDWIYVKIDPDKAKDPASDASDVATLVSSRSTSATTDNGTPPTYGTLLAVVTVANGFSSITNGNIRDARTQSTATASSLGWVPVTDSWTYSSYDSTNKTGVITVPSDATLTYSVGMRVKFANNATTQYGIITKVASTALTVYFGTDYSLTNSTISSVYYSYQKAPFGFPLDPAKWTVSADLGGITLGTTASTWYSGATAGAGTTVISIPIGIWRVGFKGSLLGTAATTADTERFATLSNSSTAEEDSKYTSHFRIATTSANTFVAPIFFFDGRYINVTTATNYYVLAKSSGSMSNHAWESVSGGLRIWAVCAYL